ncbi:hypothetical protein ABZ468_51380, partial [Streptomyces sp. NPDC005708]|uniref:hypothetical protein n=1 Tax=Streptomyces sp. NPDC005708 TaxID=3154564 RepID=UPI0033F36585
MTLRAASFEQYGTASVVWTGLVERWSDRPVGGQFHLCWGTYEHLAPIAALGRSGRGGPDAHRLQRWWRVPERIVVRSRGFARVVAVAHNAQA